MADAPSSNFLEVFDGVIASGSKNELESLLAHIGERQPGSTVSSLRAALLQYRLQQPLRSAAAAATWDYGKVDPPLGQVFDVAERAERGDLSGDSAGDQPKSPDAAAGNSGAGDAVDSVTEPEPDASANADLLFGSPAPALDLLPGGGSQLPAGHSARLLGPLPGPPPGPAPNSRPKPGGTVHAEDAGAGVEALFASFAARFESKFDAAASAAADASAAAERRIADLEQANAQLVGKGDIAAAVQQIVADPEFKAPGVATERELKLLVAVPFSDSLRKEVISLGMLPPSWPDIGAEHALPLVIPAAEHKSLLKGIPMVGKDFPQVSRVDDAKFSKLDSAGRQLFLTSKKKQYTLIDELQRHTFLAALCAGDERDDGLDDSQRLRAVCKTVSVLQRRILHDYALAEIDRINALGQALNQNKSFKQLSQSGRLASERVWLERKPLMIALILAP